MLRTNEKQLVEFFHQCQPGHPFASGRISVGYDGNPFQLPGIGGITLNIQAGDSAFGWEADHVEPSVSCKWGEKRGEAPNQSFQLLACAGNTATILTGKAKGKRGFVMGHHGGSEHVMIDFPRETKLKMTYEDKLQVRVIGMGLRLLDYPSIKVTNLAPSLLKKMKITENKRQGRIRVPVTTLVPSECMGSGLGSTQVHSGDYDIMTSDPETNREYKLDKIRFGDFVALIDQDATYGWTHRTGAVTIGIVIHSDCRLAGHGPGVSTLMTCPDGVIEPVVDRYANIADRLNIGTRLKKPQR